MSTPRTIDRNSNNSSKRGSAVSAILMTGDDPAEFERLATTYIERFRPDNAAEAFFVGEMAHARFVIERYERLYASLCAGEMERSARARRDLAA